MKNLKQVIVITGTPGTGKTAVSSFLAEKLSALHIDLSKNVMEKKLIECEDETRKTMVADMNKVAFYVSNAIERAEGTVIVEGHYALETVSSKKIRLALVLRRHPAELKNILEKRGYVKRKLWENLEAELLGVSLADALSRCDEKKICEYNVTSKRPKEVAEEIYLSMKGRRECGFGKVDWLTQLENEGLLGKFTKNIVLYSG